MDRESFNAARHKRLKKKKRRQESLEEMYRRLEALEMKKEEEE